MVDHIGKQIFYIVFGDPGRTGSLSITALGDRLRIAIEDEEIELAAVMTIRELDGFPERLIEWRDSRSEPPVRGVSRDPQRRS